MTVVRYHPWVNLAAALGGVGMIAWIVFVPHRNNLYVMIPLWMLITMWNLAGFEVGLKANRKTRQ